MSRYVYDMSRYVYDVYDDIYTMAHADGNNVMYDARSFRIEDTWTGEIIPGLTMWFAIIAGEEYAQTHKGNFGGVWFDYFLCGVFDD